MLTTNVEESAQAAAVTRVSDRETVALGGRLAKIMSIEWLGQSVASVCWIISMVSYGVSSTGDWLQLAAASAWLIANFASLASTAP